MLVILEGVAGAGKTTVARLLAEQLGAHYVAVEAPECWALSEPLARQTCFLHSFTRTVLGAVGLGERAVLDNGFLTLYAYTKAFARFNGHQPGVEALAAAALALFKSLAGDHAARTIVLDADPATLRERRALRLSADQARAVNAGVEKMEGLHAAARTFLLREASRRRLPVIRTDKRSPEEVALRIAELLEQR